MRIVGVLAAVLVSASLACPQYQPTQFRVKHTMLIEAHQGGRCR